MLYPLRTDCTNKEEVCELLNEIKKECYRFRVREHNVYTLGLTTFSYSEKGAKHPWDPFDFDQICEQILKDPLSESVAEIAYCFNKDERNWLVIEIDSDGKDLYLCAFIKSLIVYYNEDFSERLMSVSNPISSILSEDCLIAVSKNIIMQLLRYPFIFEVP